jgi:hypothetical protein
VRSGGPRPTAPREAGAVFFWKQPGALPSRAVLAACCILAVFYWVLSMAVPACTAPSGARARRVARAAVLALDLLAPVLAAARAAVLALALLAPVLAVARAAVPAPVLLAPVLAVARACHSPCTCSSRARAGSSPCRSPCTRASCARARTSVGPFSQQPCTYYCKTRSSSCRRIRWGKICT